MESFIPFGPFYHSSFRLFCAVIFIRKQNHSLGCGIYCKISSSISHLPPKKDFFVDFRFLHIPSVAGFPLMDCSRTSSYPPPVGCPRPLLLVPDDEGLRGLPRRGGHRRPAPGRAAGPNHLYHRIMGENRRGIALMQVCTNIVPQHTVYPTTATPTHNFPRTKFATKECR